MSAQLGRLPRGRWRVARACHLGVPMVIENHPQLDDGTPFPTLFWLTCPILVKRASALESEGAMQDLNEQLGENVALRSRVNDDLVRYRARRDAHLVLDVAHDQPPGGGPDRVKCLHAHLAHELADPPNAVGGVTLAAAGWPDCRIPCIEEGA